MCMEQFSVVIKNLISNKTRTVKLLCMDHYEAHKSVCDSINLFKEEIVSIKDSGKHEVYNINDGFLFEA